MLDKIKDLFLRNGYSKEQIYRIKKELIDVTMDSFKKLAMGMGILYIIILFGERNSKYIRVAVYYLSCFAIFLLLY